MLQNVYLDLTIVIKKQTRFLPYFSRLCFSFQPGYWGLGESSLGCEACECDVGGSYERNCEQVKGQCRCRKGITGRRCNQVQTGNFFPLPDHLKYESEEAKIIGVCIILVEYDLCIYGILTKEPR